ncbi:hypothetical protein AB6A40_009728 [Gnathostoma spinigerum]|uniref:Uncharacterized protein n=1 Tax=Gnathostoma spinigerum TaxID=75299 RepID=A0ABD6EXZ4_9BILA
MKTLPIPIIFVLILMCNECRTHRDSYEDHKYSNGEDEMNHLLQNIQESDATGNESDESNNIINYRLNEYFPGENDVMESPMQRDDDTVVIRAKRGWWKKVRKEMGRFGKKVKNEARRLKERNFKKYVVPVIISAAKSH